MSERLDIEPSLYLTRIVPYREPSGMMARRPDIPEDDTYWTATGLGNGWALVGAQNDLWVNRPGRLKLGDSPADVSTTSRDLLVANVGMFDDEIDAGASLGRKLFSMMLRSDKAWNPIRAGSGPRVELHLGGQRIYSMPVVSGGATNTDDFNRADGALGASWVTFDGESADNRWEVISNVAQLDIAPSGNARYAKYDTNTGDNDNYTEADIAVWSGSNANNENHGIQCRMPNTGTGNGGTNGYLFMWDEQTSTFGYRLRETTNASRNDITSAVSWTPTNGERWRIQIIGTTLKCFIDGDEKISTTDSTHTTGERGGFYGFSNTAQGRPGAWDNFENGIAIPPTESFTPVNRRKHHLAR